MRFTFSVCTILIFIAIVAAPASAQSGDPIAAAQAPVAGAGHHYIGVGVETVNPADGTLTFDLPIKTPPGRQLSFPFGVHYSSAEQSGYSGQAGTCTSSCYWVGNNPPPDDFAGWSYGLPLYTATVLVTGASPGPNCQPYPSCQTTNWCFSSENYVFSAARDGQHPLYMSNSWPKSNNMNIGCSTSTFGSGQGGNGLIGSFAGTTGQEAQPPITVTNRGGTVYQFQAPGSIPENSSSPTQFSMLAQTITDRNGNQISLSGTNLYFGALWTQGAIQPGYYQDTLGRHVVSWTGIGNTAGDQISVSGLSSPIALKWANSNFTFWMQTYYVSGTTNGPSCHVSGQSNTALLPSVSEIDLPNGQKYTFSYGGTWGRLTKVTFPDGGYVRYVWAVNENSPAWNATTNSSAAQTSWIDTNGVQQNCYYTSDTPKITDRYVSFNGSTEVLHQSFQYQTNWTTNGAGVPSWTSKITTVTSTDLLTSQVTKTIYTYGSVGQPVINLGCTGGQCGGNITWPQLVNQIPVETSVVYQDGSGHSLKTVNKTWADQYGMIGEQAILDNGQAITTLRCLDGKERVLGNYDYGFLSEGAKPADPSCAVLPQAPAGSTLSSGLNTSVMGPLRRQTISAFHTFPSSSTLDAPDSITVKDGSGNQLNQTSFAYDAGSVIASGAATGLVAPPGSRGNPTSISRWLNTTGASLAATYTYYDTGQVASITDACGSPNPACSDVTGSNHATNYSYSDSFASGTGTPPNGAQTFAYLTQVSHPNTGVAHTETYTWGYNDGLIRSHKDVENNLTTTYAYADSLLRLTQTINPDTGQTNITYNDALYSPTITISKQINSGQSITSVSKMDGLGHTVQTQLTSDPQGTVYTDTTYDGSDRVRTQSNPYRTGTDATTTTGTVTYSYDALGRKITEVLQGTDGSTITTAYCGPNTLVTDPTSRWRRSRTDGLGFLVEVDEPNAVGAAVASTGCPGTGEPIWVTNYGYDSLGNLTSVLQNGSHARSFTYDSLTRLLTSTNPEVGTITYTYDANSNVSTKNDARNITTSYTYDVLNRLKSRTYSNGDPTVSMNYDEAGCLGLSSCQNVGHRTSMTDATGSEAWSYKVNSGSSVQVDQRTTTDPSGSFSKTSTYNLDLAGNITQMVYPSGRTVNYTFDNANRPKTATDATNGLTYATGFQTPPTSTACVATAVCYTPQGTPYALSIGQSSTFTGLNITESFNSRLQPNEIKASSTGGNAFDLIYNYNDSSGHNAGHVYGITNNLDSLRSQQFTYDQLNRITSAQTTSTYSTAPTKCWSEVYTLDAWANLNSIAATTNSAYTGCTQESGFNCPATGNNYMGCGARYDAAGNMTSDTVNTYYFNAESQLFDWYQTVYGYDGDGRRVSKSDPNEPKLYWYGAGGEILTETSPVSYQILDYVYFGGKRVAQVATDTNNLNGGFEQGLTNWSASGPGTVTAVNNSTNAHSGSYYADISTPAHTTTTLTSTVPISAQIGETITMTGWAYIETMPPGNAYCRYHLVVTGSNGTSDGHTADNFTTNAWFYLSASTTIPSSLHGPYTVTVYAEVNNNYAGAPAAARFDDITLNGNTLFFAEDSLGTSRVITNTSGVVCYDADFYPFGGERPYTNTCTTHYKFEGKERDVETGNDEFGARYYSNRFGRWLSSDWSATPVPIPYATLANPQTLNLYSMVADDPETSADLDGHDDGPGGLWQPPSDFRQAAIGFLKSALVSVTNGLSFGAAHATTSYDNQDQRIGATAGPPVVGLAAALLPIGDTGSSGPRASVEPVAGVSPTERAAQTAVPDTNIVVRGGQGDLPASGTYSGAHGATLEDAASGVPHGTVRTSTAGDIRGAGGTVTPAPEPAYPGGPVNDKHVNITGGQKTFGQPKPNPVPKSNRVPSAPKPPKKPNQ